MVDFGGQMSEAPQPMTRQLWALSVTSERNDGIAVLAVNGRLGTASSLALVEAISREIRAGYLRALSEPVRLVFDLAGLLSAFAIEPSRDAGLTRLRR